MIDLDHNRRREPLGGLIHEYRLLAARQHGADLFGLHLRPSVVRRTCENETAPTTGW
jgi:hypothetical protein